MSRWNRLLHMDVYVDITGEYDDLSFKDIIEAKRGGYLDEELTRIAHDIKVGKPPLGEPT